MIALIVTLLQVIVILLRVIVILLRAIVRVIARVIVIVIVIREGGVVVLCRLKGRGRRGIRGKEKDGEWEVVREME